MPSQPRPPRGSPPRRAALHERSDSHTNERSLRMVGDPQAAMHGSPFPTKPSQILSPKGYQGSTVGAELGISSGRNPPSETIRDIEESSSVPTSEKRKGGSDVLQIYDAASTRRSSPDASFYTPQTTTPGLDTSSSFLAMDQPNEESGRVSDDIVQLPSVPSRAETSGSYASNTLGRQPIIEKDSDTSLSSSNSTGTVIVRKNRDGKKRASYSAFPNMARPSSSKSNLSLSTPQRSNDKDRDGQRPPVSPISPNSPVLPSFATPTQRRDSSALMYKNLQAASQSSLNLQYPIIRPPTASASWVKPPTSAPQLPQRVLERNQDRWNPHLSTVQSEGTGSQSEGRSSQSMWLPDSSRVSKSSSMALNGRGSSDLPPIPSPPQAVPSLDLPPLPIPPPVHRRDFTDSTIRVVDEQEDNVANLLSSIPGSRGSEYLGAPSRPPVENRNSLVVARPGSRASFFRDSIPAWAKTYYARPQSATSIPKSGHNSRPSTSTDDISLNIFRPRNRNNRETNGQLRRDSLANGPVRPRELNLAEIRGPPRRRISPDRSPHLWHDRTSLGRRRTIFQAPSIDEQAEGKAPSKRNAQILLFVLGFIFPLAWFIAAFLPLPPRPEISSVKGKNNPRRTQIAEDLEKQLGPIDEARYENARWWRNINRIMSLIGILIVAAIIALAVVATH